MKFFNKSDVCIFLRALIPILGFPYIEPIKVLNALLDNLTPVLLNKKY